MSSSSIKVIDFGNLNPGDGGRTQTGLALCPGSTFVTRLDYETNVFKDVGGPFLNGVRVYCSDNLPPSPIHYLITPGNPLSTLAQVEGKVSPNGIREAFVFADIYVNMLGYPGSFAGQSRGDAWQQTGSEVAGCLLKGVELHYIEWVDGMRLHFDCASPTPPVPSPLSAPVPLQVTVTVVLPPPTPVTSTVVVGSGALASTIVTVLMLTPTPVTITLPSNRLAIITAPPSTTTLFATDPAAAATHQQNAWRSSVLIGLLVGLALILAGVVLALAVLLARHRQRRARDAPTEGVEMACPPPPADVDPPAYLAVPVPRVDTVDVPLEPPSLKGKPSGTMDRKAHMGEEVELDASPVALPP